MFLASCFQTSSSIYTVTFWLTIPYTIQTTRCQNPKDHNTNLHRWGNIKPHSLNLRYFLRVRHQISHKYKMKQIWFPYFNSEFFFLHMRRQTKYSTLNFPEFHWFLNSSWMWVTFPTAIPKYPCVVTHFRKLFVVCLALWDMNTYWTFWGFSPNKLTWPAQTRRWWVPHISKPFCFYFWILRNGVL